MKRACSNSGWLMRSLMAAVLLAGPVRADIMIGRTPSSGAATTPAPVQPPATGSQTQEQQGSPDESAVQQPVSPETKAYADEIHKLVDSNELITADMVEKLFHITFSTSPIEYNDDFSDYFYNGMEKRVTYSGLIKPNPQPIIISKNKGLYLLGITTIFFKDKKTCLSIPDVEGWFPGQKFGSKTIQLGGLITDKAQYAFSRPSLKAGQITELDVDAGINEKGGLIKSSCLVMFTIKQMSRNQE